MAITRRSRDVPLAGDRSVAVWDYGDPEGAPVVVFHGAPACGAGFAWADEPARTPGLRLVAPDRPGVGRSSPAPAWRVADHPALVAELADALGIGTFAVWGYSGGGPYAAACAALLPERVTAAVVSAGMGQIGVWADVDDFEATDRRLLRWSTRHPTLARAALSMAGRLARWRPATALKSFEGELSDDDRRVLAEARDDPAEAMSLFTEAFTVGARGVVADYAALAQPWGVDVEDIGVPTTVWHGAEDTMVPLRHGEELAERVPGADLVVWPEAGHLGTVAHVEDILAGLAATARRRPPA
jgi:pimeloyl-ACP methyl ester carboxylesterase